MRSMIAALLALFASAPHAAPPDPIAALAAQLDRHPVLVLGEMHRHAQQHVFLRALLTDRRFVCKIDAVAIEFGNSRLQALADDYTAGVDIGEANLRSLWRETQIPFAWNAPMYRQLYETVRDVNAQRLCPRPLRLLLTDAPIDWSKVANAQDFAAVPDRDASMAEVIEREVLARGRRAVYIAGGAHALKAGPRGAADALSTSQLLERRHPGKIFCVAPIASADAAKALGFGTAPRFRIVRGSALETTAFTPIAPGANATLVKVGDKHVWQPVPGDEWPPIGAVADALLFYGPDNTRVFPSPEIYLEPVYQRELRRRVGIIKEVTGQDFPTVLDDLIREAQTKN